MGSRCAVLGMVVGLAASFSIQARVDAGVSYTFTNIADITDGYNGFHSVLGSGLGGPVLGENGEVLFLATLPSGIGGLYTGHSPASDRVVDTSGDFIDLRLPDINSSGAIAFGGETATGGRGAYRVDAGVVTRIAEVNTSSFTDIYGYTVINDSGNVLFPAIFDGGTATRGLFSGPDLVADRVVDNSNFNATFGLRQGLNNLGEIAFSSSSASTGIAVFSGPDPTTDVLIDESGTVDFFALGPMNLNDNGKVGFADGLQSGGQAVFLGTGPTPTIIADTSGPYDGFNSFYMDINNHDLVAFLAQLDGGGKGIYTGPDSVMDKVIGTGDLLFGSVVVDLNMGIGGLNDSGEIGFAYELADGRQGIAVAIPTPPTGAAALGLLVLATKRRRGR